MFQIHFKHFQNMSSYTMACKPIRTRKNCIIPRLVFNNVESAPSPFYILDNFMKKWLEWSVQPSSYECTQEVAKHLSS